MMAILPRARDVRLVHIVGLAVLLMLSLAGHARASLWFDIQWTGGHAAFIPDNGPLDLDPAVDSIRLGNPDGSPLVFGGHEFTAEGRMHQSDGIRYVTVSNGLLSGSGIDYFSVILYGDKPLPKPMVGYGSRSYRFALQQPWAMEQYARVLGEGGLHHNDFDVYFFDDLMGNLDGDPATVDGKSLVFNPAFEEDWVFHTPRWLMWTQMYFLDLPANVPTRIEFDGEVRTRFAPWVPEPTSGHIWSAFALVGLRRHGAGMRRCIRGVAG